MLQIKVCATSANVCVGFDVLGIALNMYNTFTFKKTDKTAFFGFEERFSNQNNLLYQAFIFTYKKAGKKVIPIEIGFEGDIPVARGLGSSSSLIVAGIFAANHFLDNFFSEEQLLDIACEIEGHPDNVAPAIYGGLVASFKDSDGYHSISYAVSPDLKFITIIPPFPLSTFEARAVLPKTLPYTDIVNNLSRIINLPKALAEGDISLLKKLFHDKIHEPYRGKLINGYNEIKQICEKEDVAFCISGSGSTMLVIAKNEKIIEKLKDFNYDIHVLKCGPKIQIKEV